MSITTNLVRIGLANSDGSAVNFSALTPGKKQIELGPAADYYDVNATPRVFWGVNNAGTAFESRGSGTGGGSVAKVNNVSPDGGGNVTLTPGNVGAIPIPTAWAASSSGGSPALTSGTAVRGTAYRNTTTGYTALSPAVDGITGVQYGDALICFAAGTYTLVPASYIAGIFATPTALATALAPASNAGSRALVGASAPYTLYSCDGANWTTTATTIGAAGSKTLAVTDNNSVSVNASAATITVNTGLGVGFGCAFVGAGVVSFAGTATVSDFRVSGAVNPACSLIPLGTDTYGVYGSKA